MARSTIGNLALFPGAANLGASGFQVFPQNGNAGFKLADFHALSCKLVSAITAAFGRHVLLEAVCLCRQRFDPSQQFGGWGVRGQSQLPPNLSKLVSHRVVLVGQERSRENEGIPGFGLTAAL